MLNILKINRIVAVLLAMAALVTVCDFVQLLARGAGDWALVYARDQDSALAVSGFKQTTFANPDNNNSYGPLYYRFAHVLARLDPFRLTGSFANSVLIRENSGHYTLILTSFLSFLTIVGLLAWLVGNTILQRIIACFVLAWALLQNSTWADFIYKAKPDFFLTCLTGFAFAVAAKGKANELPYRLCLSAIFWGAAIATKLNVAPLLPGFCIAIFFVLGWHRSWKSLSLFVTILFLTYVVIGYPQTADFKRVFEFVTVDYRAQSMPMDLATRRECLMDLGGQLLFPSLTIFLLSILFCERRPRESSPWLQILFLGSPLFGFAYFMTSKWVTSMSHFFMPIAVSILIIMAVSLPQVLARLRLDLSRWGWRDAIAGITVVILLFSNDALIARVASKGFDRFYICRAEAKHIAEKLVDLVENQGGYFRGDPYVPYPSVLLDSPNRKAITRGAVRKAHLVPPITAFVTNRLFYQRFFAEPPWNANLMTALDPEEHPHWKKVQDFYKEISANSVFYDDSRNRWVKTISFDNCPFELWEKLPK